MKLLVSLVFSLFSANVAMAKPTIQYFKLGEEVVERVAACRTAQAATEVIETVLKSENDSVNVFVKYMNEGVCGVGTAMLTYKRPVSKVTDKDGNLYAVYEAALADDSRIYVLVKNFSHEKEA